MNRGAVCGSSARTDLWEPRGGNNPGPPGHCRLCVYTDTISGSFSTLFRFQNPIF